MRFSLDQGFIRLVHSRLLKIHAVSTYVWILFLRLKHGSLTNSINNISQILGDEKKLKCLVEKTILEESNGKDSQGWVKTLIIKNGKELGLPPLSSDNEQVALLYETIFSQLNNKEKETADASTKEEVMDALKDILKKFEDLLETTPVYSATNL